MSQRVALALGSGGARGYAHIGVIEVLEERGFEICAVAGTSMGALVGGIFAAGRLKPFTDWAVALKRPDVLRLIDPKWSAAGAMGADRLINHLNDFLTDVEIENLPIPYTAVATDLTNRREVWFQKGQLRSAIRASIAIPGVITPVVVNGRLLADGGLLNPVPIEPTAASGADLTVAVSLQAPRPAQEPASPVRAAAAPSWARLRQVFSSRSAQATPASPVPDDLKIGDVLGLSLDAMQDLIARYRMAGLPPDIHITVPVSASGIMDFHRAPDLITLGRDLTNKALDAAGY
ncbi:patatin-like phospholipase family protein [Paractinoplanes lichenicola]|uniref:Patatin-like phospholipase family protein n=1 Tax=Paractinoplanes lichenicola TaxID=2802976 RepID=A0ABS1VUJ0_9ACTN|nr:patatin-like phospholipase family protein [Actinoplanes lichenicola]MBL7258154.1 patatin-like phospholipase family protein [Actinoplanes lichenicola]